MGAYLAPTAHIWKVKESERFKKQGSSSLRRLAQRHCKIDHVPEEQSRRYWVNKDYLLLPTIPPAASINRLEPISITERGRRKRIWL